MSLTNAFKINTGVTLLKGRFANRRAIVMGHSTDNRVIVCGVSKLHFPTQETESKLKKMKRYKKFKTDKYTEVFIKKMNPLHLIPTNEKLEDIKMIVDFEKIFADEKEKKKAKEMLSTIFKENVDNEKTKWVYANAKIWRDQNKA